MTPTGVYERPASNSLLDCLSLSETTGCWNWTKACSTYGYGQKWFRGKLIYVHRLAAHLWLGFDLNSELCVLHRCDNPRCFNPKHLFIGTRADNNKDMAQKGRSNTAASLAAIIKNKAARRQYQLPILFDKKEYHRLYYLNVTQPRLRAENPEYRARRRKIS